GARARSRAVARRRVGAVTVAAPRPTPARPVPAPRSPGRPVLALDHSSELGGAEIGLGHLAAELGGRMAVALLREGPFAERLRERGTEPFLLDPDPGAVADAVGREASVLSGATALLRQAARIRPRLLAALADTGADVLVCNSLRSAVLAALCRLPRRVRCVVMVRDGLRPPYLSPVRAAAARAAVAVAGHAVVANSAWTADTLRPSLRVRVAPPVIGREFFTEPVPRPAGAVPRVLLLGRIARWKGQLVGLAAAELVRPGLPFALTVAGGAWFGEDAYLAEVRAAARAARGPRPELLGHVTDVRSLIDAHDVVLHTSTVPEPFGQVVVQAMARGRVIVAADAGGPAEIVTGGTGRLYRPGDPRSLAAVLDEVLADERLRHELGTRARVRADAFGPDRAVRAFTDVVDALQGARS
ncbi:MAG: glycosyltransferase family 4 protein, partial [Pseudonocardiales bacterium]|nr:glycosyltransferase family 4 protein [Pseudonocardiales bacterium]